jgi:hypothetical protein
MPTLLIRRRRPLGEPAEARDPEDGGAATTLRGTAGAGRLSRVLADLAVPVDRIVQLALDPDAPLDRLDAVDAGETFETVALGSHLVNHPDQVRRRAFLRLAARHAAPGAAIVVEHHPLDWAETAEPTPPIPGAEVGMRDVRRDPPFVEAVSVYDVGGRVVRQPFRARVLTDSELDAELRAAGLARSRRRSPTWLETTARR